MNPRSTIPTGTQPTAAAVSNWLNLSLMENAVSFFEDALTNAIVAEQKPERWKFAILSLVQAIELSLKELLAKQHPVLIYTHIDKPKHTVSIELAISRLAQIAKVVLTSNESETLEFAVRVRNEIVHYQFNADLTKLQLTFARLLGFLNEFHRVHFKEALQDQIKSSLWQSGIKIQAYGDELFRRAQERMKHDEITDEHLTTCPKCGFEALSAFEPMQDTCYVCGHMEVLSICDHCQAIMLPGFENDHYSKTYCYECLCYVTDDIWHDMSKEE